MEITLLKFLSKPLNFIIGIFLLCALDASAQVSITCPPQINEPTEAGVGGSGSCGATVVFIAPVGTGSGTNITTTQTGGLPSGSFYPAGTNNIEYTVTNNEGDSDVCTFDIVVTDTEDPIFICPEDITVTADLGTCEAIVNFPVPSASDNCGVVSIIQIGGPPSGSSFPIGETNIDHEALDAEGNAAFCRFIIIVEDITAPSIICPDEAITVSAGPDCNAVVNYTPPVGVDLCTISNTTLTGGIGSGGIFPLGTTVETYTVVDIAGNSASCSFNVIVEDVSLPEITCPADISVTTEPGDCERFVIFDDATAIDNCSIPNVSQISGQVSGSSFDVGIHIIEFEAIDAAGNVATCTFEIEVSENAVPTISCPSDFTVPNETGICGATVFYESPVGNDACGTSTTVLTSGLGSGAIFPIGTTTETYTVTDGSGNQASCSFDITVEDVEVPTITCPADFEVVLPIGDCSIVINYPLPTFDDNCPGAFLTQIEGPNSGSLFITAGIKNFEFVVTDAAGNEASCTFLIEVIDNEAPTVSCPPDQIIDIPIGFCAVIVNYPDPIVDDNCPGSGYTVVSGPNSGDNLSQGTYTVEIEAFDVSGNTSFCSFQIVVSENNVPVFDCPTDLTVGTDPGSCDAVVTFNLPIALDVCSEVVVTQTGGPVTGSTFPLGNTTLTFLAEDAFGNTAVCSYDIIVEDDEAPVIDCPPDLTVGTDAGDCSAVVNFPIPIITENCGGGSIFQTSGPASGSTFNTGSTPITFIATDAVGNSSECTYNIIVEDDEAPEIICPADFSFEIPGGECSTLINYPDPTVNDNCPGETFSLISGPANGDDIGPGMYTVVIEGADAAGNTSTCSFEIVITETSSPVITCPSDLIVPADPGSCEATVAFPLPTASDSCSTVTVIQTSGPASGSVFPAGTTTLTFEAEDEYGNTATCSYNVTVVDDIDPEITCPDDVSVDNDITLCSAIVTYDPPIVDDNCGIASVLQTAGLGSGSVFPVGVTTETYEVTDISGNTSTCSFDITVLDSELPEIACPADITEIILDNSCELIVNYALPTATDNCGVDQINLISGLASGEAFPVGVNTVTYEVIDINGNADTCSFTVTITENILPEIVCPSDISVSNDLGLCGTVVNYTPPVGTDNCDGASTALTAGLGTGSLFPVGTTTETYTVTDASGNSVSCSFTITVIDDEDPVLDCGTDLTVSADPGVCEAVVGYQIPTVTDNCTSGIVPVLVSGPASGSVFPVGTTTVTFEATDAAGNTGTCAIGITVLDEEAPTIACPADIEIDAASGDCETIVNYADPTFADNCPGTTISLLSGLASGESFPLGVTIVTFEATDAAGNVEECSFSVTVSEDVLPIITCPGDIVVDNDLGECEAIVDFIAPVGTDNCGGATTVLISGLAPGSLFPEGTTIVTYQVTDISGNQAECSFTVTVEDNESPVIDCPTNETLSADANCEAVFTFSLPTVTDNCSPNLVTIQTGGPASGTALPLGTTTFTFTSEDAALNLATCSYDVTVIDDEDPTFTLCPGDITLIVDPSMCEAFLSYTEPTATDNCQVTVSQVSGPSNNTDISVGVYNVSYSAEDGAGNTALCDFSVTVLDTISPVITCPVDFESCEVAPTFDDPTATDNCTIASIIQTGGPTSGGTFVVGDNLITFEATDVNGNTSSCSFTIQVNESAPRADAGPDLNICDENSVTLNGSASENASATWSLLSGAGDIISPNSSSTDVNNLGTGANSFIYTLDPENGCPISQDTIVVNVEPGVVVDAGSDASIESGGSALLSGSVSPTGGDIFWTPSDDLSCVTCLSPTASPAETTTYYLDYTTPLGCSKIDSVTVRVFEEFPNTITPDGDGVNDVWNIPGIDNYPDAYVVIYNRWGNEIFQSTGYQEAWDGKLDGDDLPTGSYFYIIDYKESGKGKLNGTVNIIR